MMRERHSLGMRAEANAPYDPQGRPATLPTPKEYATAKRADPTGGRVSKDELAAYVASAGGTVSNSTLFRSADLSREASAVLVAAALEDVNEGD